MSTLVDFLEGVRTGLAADSRLVALKATVSTHGGEFKLEDLERYAKQAPAVVVGLLKVETEEQGSALQADVTVAIVCLDKAKAGATQHTRCLQLTDATLRALRGRFWVDSLNLSRPKNLAAKNLFSVKLDQTGVAMWAIAFDQSVDLIDDAYTPVDWTRWHADWDLQPTDEDRPHAEDQGELEGAS